MMEGLAHIGESLLGDGLVGGGETLRGEEVAAAARLGLSKVNGNSEFQVDAHREACDAEQYLEALRRDAMVRVVRSQEELCRAQQEAALEQEKRKQSEKIEAELAALREEMRRKEIQEEERLQHLYRAVLAPAVAAGAPDRQQPHIISSSVSMLNAGDPYADLAHRPPEAPREGLKEFESLLCTRSSSRDWSRERSYWPQERSAAAKLSLERQRPVNVDRVQPPLPRSEQHAYRRRRVSKSAVDESREVNALLKKNLAMLSRLEGLGF
mmetsp:Transcript_115/g.326  ORF Transcript_115/g.326 Transcript_115/m.326 type:complete len:268 (-) Transcript_115:64-867(-)